MKKKLDYKVPELKAIVINTEQNLLDGSDQHQGQQGDEPAAKEDGFESFDW